MLTPVVLGGVFPALMAVAPIGMAWFATQPLPALPPLFWGASRRQKRQRSFTGNWESSPEGYPTMLLGHFALSMLRCGWSRSTLQPARSTGV